MRRPLLLVSAALAFGTTPPEALDRPWVRHTIDDSSRGADGVRFADADGDGDLDIATGWEQGGVARLYRNPGPARVRERWPRVEVGAAGDVEDAVLVDLDRDGAGDVVSSSEGNTREIRVHWAPREPSRTLDPRSWASAVVDASRGRMWMFSLPMDVDGRDGIDLVAGAKGEGAEIGWFSSPAAPRRLAEWSWHRWRAAGWVMSLVPSDMDGDGDQDVVFSDRKGDRTGCFWLENPGSARSAAGEPWREHAIGAAGREAMFLTLADYDGDGLEDVVAAVRPHEIFFLRRLGRDGKRWEGRPIPLPKQAGGAKAVSVGDVDLDGRVDIVFSCEGARPPLEGVMWLDGRRGKAHPISGPEGVKFDLVPLVDLDLDGDLDAITSEENSNLGVIWYENPLRRAR